ncbi:50S ribosomal protein L25 [Glutamicibacter mysorens]|jgi:large subunit ribosomal protein L25|uniref:Large subunit ribosomal protein L25 n=2 Tax=Glutamicibacter TaxID=1742989 RepID=A0ABX4MUI1_9MICC|nr:MULTISPECIES: 50S ribosomal protein L25 [Glutamicibacter]KWR73891.1 50S ribosomal protein L25 [Arthrobacter sp. W1]MDV2978882.1 50S ribosomal protein L25 [Actinomycetes bacterium ARC8]MBM7767649.1 large subunit ribosomal protein L25 [Glutamicibacter nicotianae]PJJ43094.1 large subunit ribosomal protein L25 [Glutamicibacter mysorens]QEP06485.1 50S ribosomal protein L25 [Glutamicibacter sp. ZJUTW]
MASVNLDAVVRTDFGKGAARQARRDGQIPAVVYGAGSEPQHVLLPGRETTLAVRDRGVELVLNIEGKTVKTTIKDIQIHALNRTVDHLDLIIAA